MNAADLAWRAAALLPDNEPAKLFILHEAGRWLANRDPDAADRFYQEILRRCPDLPEARELDRRRWFLPQAPDAQPPELPPALHFALPDFAASGFQRFNLPRQGHRSSSAGLQKSRAAFRVANVAG